MHDDSLIELPMKRPKVHYRQRNAWPKQPEIAQHEVGRLGLRTRAIP